MKWNWELADWPRFAYQSDRLGEWDRQFLQRVRSSLTLLRDIGQEDHRRFTIEILTTEGVESARIEGEVLERESLQSSIQRHFGLPTAQRTHPREAKMAALLYSVYESCHEPLSHEMLWKWYSLLFGQAGEYRQFVDPMQIVSNRLDGQHVYFKAPPAERIKEEMGVFIQWFNTPELSILGKASIAHLYFESIHPFEDGNGRIGRVLVEKLLSQSVHHPQLISLSQYLERHKKAYYSNLEKCNHTLHVSHWVEFFAHAILEAQKESLNWLYFLVAKSRLLHRLDGDLNERQLKVLLRMFEEGPAGFQGGLSAKKYIAITKTTRSTATRDLADLVKKGALAQTGEVRHTRYWLNLPEKCDAY